MHVHSNSSWGGSGGDSSNSGGGSGGDKEKRL
jgi:hypothetical protein